MIVFKVLFIIITNLLLLFAVDSISEKIETGAKREPLFILIKAALTTIQTVLILL